MNTETTITIKFDCTPRLEKVMMSIAAGLGGVMTQSEKSVEVENDNAPAATEAPKRTRTKATTEKKPKTEKTQSEKVETSEVSNAPEETEQHAEEAPAEQESRTISNEELRAEVKACRLRILNGKTDPILQSMIRDNLKEKVAEYGVSASVDIPQDKRAEFIEYCRTLTISNEDNAPY